MDTGPTPPTPLPPPVQLDRDRAGPTMDGDIDEPRHVPMTWDESHNENNFHDIVNDDEEMYSAINDVPNNDHEMVNQVIGIVHIHISEIWSPPRVTKLAE